MTPALNPSEEPPMQHPVLSREEWRAARAAKYFTTW